MITMNAYKGVTRVPRGVAVDMLTRDLGHYGFILDPKAQKIRAVKRIEDGLKVVASRQYKFAKEATQKSVLERMLEAALPTIKATDGPTVYIKDPVMREFHGTMNHLPRSAKIVTY